MCERDESRQPDCGADELQPEESLPIGIVRIREEWRAAGLAEPSEAPVCPSEPEPIVFPEVEGGAGVGDYTLEYEDAVARLGLTRDAVDRLIAGGELDSILLQGADGKARRLISQSSFERFQKDSAIDPDALERAARAIADKSLVATVDELRTEIQELKRTQTRILQQMKDILLLEIRNLKEQDRDLTSFVYELAEEINEIIPKKRKRGLTGKQN